VKNQYGILGVVVLACLASAAQAAPPARNGAYGVFYGAHATWDRSKEEADAMIQGFIENYGNNGFTNYTSKYTDSDIAYQFEFGYRFANYLAISIGAMDLGAIETRAQADVLDDDGEYFATDTRMTFGASGPAISVIGILPVTQELEFFARLGILLTSPRIDVRANIDGSIARGVGKGESREAVYGLGMSWNFSQRWSARAEYQVINDVGEAKVTGESTVTLINLGVVSRF
jgi:opacity protein-like surface antigen